jgi:hypothetical protein
MKVTSAIAASCSSGLSSRCRWAIPALAMCLSGCASLLYKAPDVRGSLKQQVEVTSDPVGATVRLNGIIVGVTPTKVAVRRRESGQTLSLDKEGFTGVEVALKRRPDAATFGNLALAALALNPLSGPNGLSDNPWSRSQQVLFAFVFPVVGFGLDLATGAAYAVPSRVHVTLKPKSVQQH